MNKAYIKGIGIYPFKSEQQITKFASKHKGIFVAVNAEKILNQTDKTRAIINRNVGFCDGAGPLLMLHRMGHAKAIKVAGCELWLMLIERYYKEKTFYLVGSKQQVIEDTVSKLRTHFEGINIIGYRNGYLQNDYEKNKLLDDIAEKKPDVVFVAMGSPKQELLMEEMLQKHKAIYQGLGGNFDVYTGHVSRAPQWWVKHNIEWLYRLICQPRRIKRQIKLVKFAWWIATKSFK